MLIHGGIRRWLPKQKFQYILCFMLIKEDAAEEDGTKVFQYILCFMLIDISIFIAFQI